MLTFLADENFNYPIVKGLRRLEPTIDVLRVQATEIAEADDSIVLDFALRQNRVLITHDIKTIPPLIDQLQSIGLTTPGVILIGQHLPLKPTIGDLYIIAHTTTHTEWLNKYQFLPLPGPSWF